MGGVCGACGSSPLRPPAAAGRGGSPVEFPGVSRGWKWLQESGFSFTPEPPAYIGGSCLDPAPGLAAPAGSIPAPFSPCLRAAGGSRLPTPSPRAAGAAGASASLLHESRVIFSSVMCPSWLRRRLGRGSGSLPREQGDALAPGPRPGLIWEQERLFWGGEGHPCVVPSPQHPPRMAGSGDLCDFRNQSLGWHPSLRQPLEYPPLSPGLPPR